MSGHDRKIHEKQTPGRPKCFSSPSGGRTPQGGGLGGALSLSDHALGAQCLATPSTRQPTRARGVALAAAKTGSKTPSLRAFAACLALCTPASGPLSGRANNRARKPCATVGVHYRALGRPAVADHPGPETGLRWTGRRLGHRLGRLVACGTPPSVEARESRHSDRSGSHTSAS